VSREALDAALEKWRANWPEWAIAELFVPHPLRGTAVAWFALLDEFARAAWGGSDPAPGLAKLAWWQEELRGWAKGARRHPLGMALQVHAVDWNRLADALSLLRDRDALVGEGTAVASTLPFAGVAASVESELFGDTPVEASRLARTLRVSTGWPVRGLAPAGGAKGPVPRRVLDALAELRMVATAKGRSLPRWRLPWVAWLAARSR